MNKQPYREIELAEFYTILESGTTKILDVREAWESPKLEGEMVLHIPVSQIIQSIDAIPQEEDLIVACQHGVRSLSVVEYLHKQHGFLNLLNLRGGLTPDH
ncbi:MAG: rhodanese-like domain-containing protein [Candidatus Marinimicrobia bacterium]|nr:rhodanese-like domain-containing protein [Candidatus Neomarinimicrobiota bacterium]MCF7904456.1 rhodanese-like domain-containing protein [Candidatus Neomarinimicrobiota bacterium]